MNKYIKKTLLALTVVSLLFPSVVSAAPTSWDYASGILQPLLSQVAAQIKGSSFVATSTASASRSIFTNASTTALSANVFCLTGDSCRTSWPSAASGGLATTTPWTTNDLAQVVSNSTLRSVATSSLGLPTFGGNNNFTAHNIFSSLFATNASSTNATTSTFAITSLGTPAGAFLAVNPSGVVIATTTPTGGGSVTGSGVAGMLAAWTSSSALTATGTPHAASYVATSTSVASIFPFASTTGLTVSRIASTTDLIVSGSVGIGSSTPSALLSVNGGLSGNTAYFWNNSPSGRTRVTIRGGAGESSTPVLNIVDNTNTQQAYIRNDGYIAGTVIGTMNDQTVVLTQNSSSDEKPGIDFNNTAMATWSSNGFWWGPKDTGIARSAAGILEVNNGTAGTLAQLISSALGVGTTTPGTLLSLGNTGNSTINLTPTGTSTFGLGINLRGGCYAVNGTCIGNTSDTTTTGHATSTTDAVLYDISVDANDILQVWYETHRNRDNVCTSGSGTFGVNFLLKQSTYSATSTVATTGSNNDNGSGCSLSFFTMFTATTTETISIMTDQTDGQYSSVMYTLYKR